MRPLSAIGVCCPAGCCPAGHSCCGENHCCPAGTTCCDEGGCCPAAAPKCLGGNKCGRESGSFLDAVVDATVVPQAGAPPLP